MEWFAIVCIFLIPQILGWHIIWLVLDHNSKFQKKRLRKSLDLVYDYIKTLDKAVHDGIKFHEVKVIHKNREFNIGIYKKEHNFRYTTYEIFINGEEAGILHRVGDCCTSYYYFERQNNREQYEVMEIVNAGAKKVKKLNRACTEKKSSWNEYSYFK